MQGKKASHLQEGFNVLHNTQYSCHPPATGHNNATGYLAPSVVVRPRPVATYRLAHTLTVSVAALAFRAADSLAVQHAVKGHGALLLGLSAALRVQKAHIFHKSNTFSYSDHRLNPYQSAIQIFPSSQGCDLFEAT